MTPIDLLKRYWGYSSFRQPQDAIIQSVLDGRDTLVLMPTGGGKSICYQLPALAFDGITIVISPLIALMKDQVQQLKDRGIKAAFLVSGMNGHEQEIVYNNCLHGSCKLLYISPERLRLRIFVEHLRQMQVSLVAVDEAHCISQWGYDFRPAYLEISKIRLIHPNAPILALTATATPAVAKDIKQQLTFKPNHQVFVSSFERSNLCYMAFCETDKIGRLLRIINNTPGSGIVYVRNRQRTQEIAATLRDHNISAEYYHAGRTQKERDICQQQWMDGNLRVIVATNAFGMGIDKKDVRYVVHLDLPDAPEAYFQEAGRAGRDGLRSYCVALYDHQDIAKLSQNLKDKYPPLKMVRNAYRILCNYYQIPIGSGEGTQFPFDIQAICNTYHLKVVEFYNALTILEREGVISMTPLQETSSRLLILVEANTLYQFQTTNHRHTGIITAILRLYGGIYTDYVNIDELQIARQCNCDTPTVVKHLKQLDALKIVSYLPKIDGPRITFTTQCVNPDSLTLNESLYQQLQKSADKRVAAIIQYLKLDQDSCRQQFLLSYFGETLSHHCNCCDLCITRNRATQPRNTLKDIATNLDREIIQIVGKLQPIATESLINQIVKNHNDETIADTALIQLRNLVDRREIRLNCNQLTLP
ncbi:MAG: RecQ family ATP-dependent DNA helicase [Bacteroidales bacterium]|nr:RecQ family ATP-dependent DNA helicase [Candidatus Colimorpha onthohippi]